ncbi:MAG: hypothetical protein D6798_18070 [Deltaproteobacteria bacterium]|nr:MAG: hypothetical protein D6798_18070 [Deltaproteobacteria bacterium]
MLDPDAILDQHLPTLPRDRLSPALLRLARRVPRAVDLLAPRLDEPLDRALLGVGDPPVEDALPRAVLSAVAAVDGGNRLSPADAAALEARARAAGDACPPTTRVLAAQVHAACSEARVREARRRLGVQDLPYVFPGDLHPVVVDILACGDRVMPALHVDWARKLTVLAADALVQDCRALGLWFWPVLRALATDRLVKPIARLRRARRLPPGGLGLAAAYAFRVGGDWQELVAAGGPADAVIAALAVVGDRPG